MKLNNFQQSKIIYLLISLLTTFIVESYIIIIENQLLLNQIKLSTILSFFSMKKTILLLIIFLILFKIILNKDLRRKTLNFLYTNRYIISLIILVIAVIFKIHGSSINVINIFNYPHEPLLGIARNVRSDEYMVNTLFAFSQYPNEFNYFSNIPRATLTDMFIIYGQPVLDLAIIFRPFQIGYLFLDQSRGLSFFWISRLIVLFLISFEFGMLISNKNKKIALAYTFLITLSPAVQWWFAINGLVEQLIFGQLGVILINKYMEKNDTIKRAIYCILFLICIGGFVFVFYPSWQIPFAYVFVIIALYYIYKNYKNFTINYIDIIIFLIISGLFSLLILHILQNSFNTILTITSTIYPGNEIHNGQGIISQYLEYIDTIFFPLYGNNNELLVNLPNVCEGSFFYDFFPIPYILALFIIFVQKNRDKLLIILLILFSVFSVLYLFQVPDLINNLLLFNHVKRIRLYLIISYIGILLLIRCVTIIKPIKRKKLAILSSLIITTIIITTFYLTTNSNYLITLLIISFIVLFISISFIILSGNKKAKTGLLICCILISLATGALVNPIEYGTDSIFNTGYANEVTNIVSENPNATWIVIGMPINYLLPFGAHTLNSVNTYPNLNTWHLIDKNNSNEDTYNRYAHILLDIQNENDTTFNLTAQDIVKINLNINDLNTLNVTYIATNKDISNLSNEKIVFEKIYEENNCFIFKVNYKQ